MLQESPLPRSPAARGRRLMQFALSAALTVLFLWIAFRGTDTGKLLVLVRGANYWWMLAMFACLMGSHAVRSWRWGYLLSPIKRGIGFRNLFAGVMIGYLFNNILPRAGEIARPYAISRMESLPVSSAFGTIVVERIIDTFSFLLLVALLPLVYDGPLLDSFPWLQSAGLIITGVTSAGLVLLVAMMVRRDWTDRFLLRPLKWVLPERARLRTEEQVYAFLDGFLFLKEPASFAVIALSGVLVWFLYIVMTYLALFAFGLGRLGPRAAVVLLTISSIGVAIPTPGSTGSYHAFTSQTLIRLFAVDPSVALGFATVTHAVGFIGVTLVGLYYFIRDRLAHSRKTTVPFLLMGAALCAFPQVRAQTHPGPAPRASLEAGMGVEYASYSDLTDLVNATALPAERVPRFKSAVEFFGACALPLSDVWLVKLEYAYTIASWSPQGAFGPASFSVSAHMPSVILQYMLTDRGVYNVRVGAGGGYHFGILAEKYLSLDDTFRGKGPGMVVELEANTAFGDHLFAFLGGNIRWEFIGGLLDASGVSPGVASGGSGSTLHSFGVGARLGASYLF